MKKGKVFAMVLKDTYAEKYKTPLKEIKEDLNRWKDILCSWIR